MRSSLAPVLVAAFLVSVGLASCATSGTGGSGGTGTGTGTGGQGTGGAPSDAGMDAPAMNDSGMDAPLDSAPDGPGCKLASPFSSSNMVCNDCAQEKCCPQINGCLQDTACNDDYVNCSLVCAFTDYDAGADAGTEAGCLADCAKQYPKGKAEYDVAFGCADSACTAECQ
ncbi:MAG: hypothetical protein ABJE95_36205 [Byssovorax sp.]